MNFSKFSPRIRKFLTKNPCYTAEKTKNNLKLYIELTLTVLGNKKASNWMLFLYDMF
ncbi:hypothetical protein IMCC3317_38860 [Kordia antarctica]|uniref:Uncharacterized protein n=1 Tax=Kordia antarctica TaxID=1218801 RepID=A0A7L4ZP53_9FLAO|nr:hypothetical protein IMCC3317_38860 [Kordia antarctica]